MERKKCIKPTCGRVFKAGDPDFEDGHCTCGARLMALATMPEAERRTDEGQAGASAPVQETAPLQTGPKQEQTAASNASPSTAFTPFLDDEDTLVFFGDETPEVTGETAAAEEVVDQLVLFHQGEVFQTVPLLYDEILIGRSSQGVEPDLDLTPLDPGRQVSRRHALLYRYRGKYRIRNLSGKNSLHVDGVPLLQDQECELEDGAQIVLSRVIGLEFQAKS